MIVSAPLNRTFSIAITRGLTHRSLFLFGQSPRVLHTEKYLTDFSMFCWCESSTPDLPGNSVRDQHQVDCNGGLTINQQTKNTGTVLSLPKSNAEIVPVKAVGVNTVYDSFPRSNDSVASTASRHESTAVKMLPAQKYQENRFSRNARNGSSVQRALARSRSSPA
jgi:hypothetical protein